MVRLTPVDSAHYLGPVLEASLTRVKDKTGERWTPAFVMSRIASGDAGLYRFHDDGEHMGYMVCELYSQGESPWMNVWVLEGQGLARFEECAPLIDALARSIGAVAWRATGRRGWAKFLKPVATVYERVLQ